MSENESHLLCGDDLPISLSGQREPCDTRQSVLRGVGRIAPCRRAGSDQSGLPWGSRSHFPQGV